MAENKAEKKKEITIYDLPGVGAATAEKLKEAGYSTLMNIAVASPGELVEAAGVGEAVARKMINSARNKLDMGFISGDELLKKRESITKITTCSKALDALLGGGVESNAITELFGEYGSGKSNIAHQLAVTVQLPKDKGGVEGMCVWIDSESTFRPERIKQIAMALNLDPEIVLKNIKVARAFNSDHQMLLIEKISDLITTQNLPIKLVVVDSLMSHFRADYIGRGTLSDRQQKINRHMHDLLKLAEEYNLIVYVTNQVMAKPDMFFGDPTVAVGGHVLAHACLKSDSLIQLNDGGIVPIGDINTGSVTGVSFTNLKTKKSEIDNTFSNITTNEIYKIETVNGNINASKNHKFFKLENFEIKEVTAGDLKLGDYIARINKLSFNLTEQRLPDIKSRELFVVTKDGSEFIKKELMRLGYTRKDNSKKNICKRLNITARQLRRVLNQNYPTYKQNITLLVDAGVSNEVVEFVQPFYTNKHKQLTMPEYFTPEIAQILGYFIGDGCFEDRSLRFRDERLDVITHYSSLLRTAFNIDGKISKVKDKNCFNLGANNKELKQLFLELDRDTYSYVSKSPLEHVKAFIRGFTDAEGYVSKKRPIITIGQKDEMILRFIQLLLYRVGINSSLKKAKNSTNREFFNLRIDGEGFLRFASEVGVTALDKKYILINHIKLCTKIGHKNLIPVLRREIWNMLKEIGYPSHFMKSKTDKFMSLNNVKKMLDKLKDIDTAKIKNKVQLLKDLINGDITFDEVKEVNKIENKEVLYDISAPETRNYIANGYIVHNSTYRIYLRKGKKGSRVARVVDAPHLPDSEAVFMITENGIRDVSD